MKFGIDLGHGVGSDRGAIGNISEETIINAVGELVISKLKALGYTVIELRPVTATSVNNSLQQRYNKADFNNVDIVISIHANAGGGVGTEIYTYSAKEVPQARAILNNIVALGFKNRGIKSGNHLAMVKRPKAIAMLLEICFVDSSDSELYNKIGAQKLANAIVKGLTGQTAEKYYVVTNYLPYAYKGYDGVDINYVLSYFKGVKCYVRYNSKGVWIETEYLSKQKCQELKKILGSWFYEIVEE